MDRRLAPSKALCRERPVGIKKLGMDEGPLSSMGMVAPSPLVMLVWPAGESRGDVGGDRGDSKVLEIKDNVLIRGGGDDDVAESFDLMVIGFCCW